MTGLDSNVLLRYLAQDDRAQSSRATRLIEHELSDRAPGYISLVVLVETCWVLKRIYGVTAAEIKATVRDFLDTRQLMVERRVAVAHALERAGAGNFVDALITDVAMDAGCSRVVTFDRKAARLGMTLLAPA